MSNPEASTNPAQDAKDGNLEALFGLMTTEGDDDREAYKWLCVASDYGHEEANDLIDDLLEVSSLRYDDDRYEQSLAHWEIALGYLQNSDGLPLDHELAAKHFGYCFDGFDAQSLEQLYSVSQTLATLDGPTKQVLEQALATAS